MKKKLIAVIISICTIGGIGTAIALSSNTDSIVTTENNKVVQEKVDEEKVDEKKEETNDVKDEKNIAENEKKDEGNVIEGTADEVQVASVNNSEEIQYEEPSETFEESKNYVASDTTVEEVNVPEVSISNDGYQNQSYDSNFMAEVESMIFSKVNEERSKNGLAPLTYNSTMEHYARIKSQDMGDRGYFDHNNPEGELITAQMQRDGVSYRSWGENIAYIGGVSDVAALANQFMTNWMNSSGHRANILSSNFTSIGIGVYKVGNMVYATQEFYN